MPVHGVDRLYIGDQLIVGGSCKPAFPYYDINSNTILYCPLNEDFTDKTGHYTLASSGSPTTGEYDGIDVTYFNKNYIYTSSNYTRNQTITVSVIVKIVGNGGDIIGQWQTNSPREWFIGSGSSYHGYSSSYSKTYTLNNDQWYTITVVFPTSSTYPTVYINGVSTGTTGSFVGNRRGGCPIYIGWNGNGSPGLQAYISNAIVENGDWGSTKALEWHNKVKNYYGIA